MVKFSIITISFNQAQYLNACIQSVISQNSKLFEYIVVDPGSTDESRNIIDQNKNYIQSVVYEKDKGPADGLNKGLAIARGDYLLFINADDILLPGALNKIAKLLDRHKLPEILLCAGWLIDQNGHPIRRLFSTRFSNWGLVNHRASLFQQGMVISRNLFNQIGGFNPENQTCWDFELLVDSIKNGAKPSITTSRVAAFRIHHESISGGHYGTEMDIRFANDLARIHGKLYPDERPQSHLDISLVARFEKYIRTPEILPYIFHDKLLKSMVKRVWAKDILS